MTGQTQSQREWIEHRYFRTYRIAAEFNAIANGYFDLRELEDLTVDDGILDFVAPWQKENAAQKVARWIADRLFYDDTGGPYVLSHIVESGHPIEIVRNLPVDLALIAYGFDHVPFDVPPPDGDYIEIRPNVREWVESSNVADLCHQYFIENLRLSAAYDQLLHRIGEEVFHIVFMNRAAMAGMNRFLSDYVKYLDSDTLNDNPHGVKVSKREGRLTRRLAKLERCSSWPRRRPRCRPR